MKKYVYWFPQIPTCGVCGQCMAQAEVPGAYEVRTKIKIQCLNYKCADYEKLFWLPCNDLLLTSVEPYE